MKVFNLTNVETPKLKRLGQVNMSFKVAGVVVTPGKHVSVKDTKAARQELSNYVSSGAAAIDKPPKAWVDAQRKSPGPSVLDRMKEVAAPKHEEKAEAPKAEEKKAEGSSGRRRRSD